MSEPWSSTNFCTHLIISKTSRFIPCILPNLYSATCTHAGGETWVIGFKFKLELGLATEFQISPIQTLNMPQIPIEKGCPFLNPTASNACGRRLSPSPAHQRPPLQFSAGRNKIWQAGPTQPGKNEASVRAGSFTRCESATQWCVRGNISAVGASFK